MLRQARLLAIILILHACNAAPPRVEGPPKLLDSFIPASMQIMAHLTELMKYDLRPQTGRPTTTTSTVRPTSSHKPAILAPELPPGPEAYFARGATYADYIKRLQKPSPDNYFDRYIYSGGAAEARRLSFDRQDNQPDIELIWGKQFGDTLRLVNRIETDFNSKDIDVQVQEFSQNYDDSDFRFELLRQKRVPPTRAYVTLLSLYDLLNKECKLLGFNKYQGFSDTVLMQLAEASTGTSAYQLRTVMTNIIRKQETKKPEIIKKINQLVSDLDQDNSYMNDALRYIPPLMYSV